LTTIAIVDVGTNTTRLYLADVEDGRVTHELLRTSQVTRLGAGVDASGRLAPDALAREHTTLKSYAATIEEHQPARAVAVMTSAVRDASNGEQFADEAAARYGLDVHVLSGDEEARLTYLGATDGDTQTTDGNAQTHAAPADPATPTRVLVMDIGGGSTELVVGHGETIDFHVSKQAGVVRQADRHLRTDPPAEAELEAVAADVRAILERAVPEQFRTGVGRALAVAGTPTSLAAIAQELDPYDPARVHGYEITADARDAIFARLKAMPLARRQQVKGLHPDRAQAILPGIIILREVMELFGLYTVEASEHDILRGAAIAYAR
jgi:exopolyphosphatase/guanosine-5'-triphosphate,3'-diphosphate pyrophosphatase